MSSQRDEEQKKLIKEVKENAILENAQRAGKAKQSPYEKAGTIAAVNEILEENQEILKKKGGKTTLYKLIRDLIASQTISAPKEPTEKTILQWITNFENRKSASYYRKSASYFLEAAHRGGYSFAYRNASTTQAGPTKRRR